MFNATFNNMSVISWQLVLLVEETGLPKEKPPIWRKSHNDISSTPPHEVSKICSDGMVIKRKIKQWCSTILPISHITKRTTTSHLKQLNTTGPRTTYGAGNLDPDMGQAQTYGGIKLVNVVMMGRLAALHHFQKWLP